MSDAQIVRRPSVRDVLDRLAREGLLPPGIEADAVTRAARGVLTTLEANHTPWYLRLLIGFGAWAGAGFFLSFVLGIVALVLGRQFNSVAIVLGLFCLAGATLLRRRITGSTIGALFGGQIALVFCFTGGILFIGGIGDQFDSLIVASIAVLALAAVLIALFPDRIARFCCAGLAVGALLTIFFEVRLPHGADALTLALVAAPLLLWRATPRAWSAGAAEIVEPVAYALMLSLFGLLLVHAFFGFVDVNPHDWFRLGLAVTIGLVVALLWLVCTILSEQGVANMGSTEVALACGVIVLLGYLTRTTPAILATLLATILGFDRHARGLIGLAALFFVVFASLYYYSLELTLMQKSGVLVASGVVCLAAAAFVRWRFASLHPVEDAVQEVAS